MGVLYAIFGLVFGLLFSTIFSAASFLFPGGEAFPFLFGSFAITQRVVLVELIVLPIVYGIMGFIVGLIMAVLYNFVAKHVGGLEIEVGK